MQIVTNSKPLVVTATGVKRGARGTVIRATTPDAATQVKQELSSLDKGHARKLRKELRDFGHTGLSGLRVA